MGLGLRVNDDVLFPLSCSSLMLLPATSYNLLVLSF